MEGKDSCPVAGFPATGQLLCVFGLRPDASGPARIATASIPVRNSRTLLLSSPGLEMGDIMPLLPTSVLPKRIPHGFHKSSAIQVSPLLLEAAGSEPEPHTTLPCGRVMTRLVLFGERRERPDGRPRA